VNCLQFINSSHCSQWMGLIRYAYVAVYSAVYRVALIPSFTRWQILFGVVVVLRVVKNISCIILYIIYIYIYIQVSPPNGGKLIRVRWKWHTRDLCLTNHTFGWQRNCVSILSTVSLGQVSGRVGCGRLNAKRVFVYVGKPWSTGQMKRILYINVAADPAGRKLSYELVI